MRKIKKKGWDLPAKDKRAYFVILLIFPVIALFLLQLLFRELLSYLALLDQTVAAVSYPREGLMLIAALSWSPVAIWFAFQYDKRQPFFFNKKRNYRFFNQEPFFSKAYWKRAAQKPLQYVLLACCILVMIACYILCFNNRLCITTDCVLYRLNGLGQITDYYTQDQIQNAELYAYRDTWKTSAALCLFLDLEDGSHGKFDLNDFRDGVFFDTLEQAKKTAKHVEITCDPANTERIEAWFDMDTQTKQRFRALFELE